MFLFLDLETTGLDPQNDEILSLTMIVYDYENNVFHTRLNRFFKPAYHSEWPEAEKINNISPQIVKNFTSIKESLSEIQHIINECSKIFIYNVSFDTKFLEFVGIDFSGKTFIDPMISYASRYTNGKWKSLSYVYNNLVGHDFLFTHTSLGDTLALIEISLLLYPELFRVDVSYALELLYA